MILATSAVAVLMHYISVREGFYKRGSLPQRYHNPCALVYAQQPGAIPGVRGFAWFVSDPDGWAACYRDIQHKAVVHHDFHRAWEYLK